MLNDLDRPTARRDDADLTVMAGLVIGALLGALVWTFIALVISAIV